MKARLHAIERFMIDKMGHYINPFHVETTLDEFGSFDIIAKWPDIKVEKHFSLEVTIEDITVDEFSRLTGIKTVEQLHFVSPHMLVDYFYKGVAKLFCMNDTRQYYCEVCYQKQGDTLIMYDEDRDVRLEIKEKLETPDDFLTFTKRYLKML